MTARPVRPGDAHSVPAGDSAPTETEVLSKRFPIRGEHGPELIHFRGDEALIRDPRCFEDVPF